MEAIQEGINGGYSSCYIVDQVYLCVQLVGQCWSLYHKYVRTCKTADLNKYFFCGDALFILQIRLLSRSFLNR